MKKYTQILHRLFSRKLVLLITFFVAGALAGSLLTALLTNNGPRNSYPNRSSSSISMEEQAEREEQATERLDTSVERSLKQIDEDLESKKLTQEQAKKLKVKVNEIKEYLAKVDRGDSQTRKELREKRDEWRKWADKNKLSPIYLLRLN